MTSVESRANGGKVAGYRRTEAFKSIGARAALRSSWLSLAATCLLGCASAGSPNGSVGAAGGGSGGSQVAEGPSQAGVPNAVGSPAAGSAGSVGSGGGGSAGESGAVGGGGGGGGSGGGLVDSGVGELAKPADSFVDVVGVNGHLNYEPSVYTDLFDAAILPRVTELGIRNWRDALSPHDVVLQRQKKLAQVGVRFNLIVQELDIPATMNMVKGALSVTSSVEGPNELDHGFRNGVAAYPDASTRTYKGLGFPGVVAAFQNDLYTAIKGDPLTQQLKVLMAGFSFPDNTLDVGLVAGCDCANTHSYPDGGLPTFRLDDWYIPRMQVNSGPDKPLCATETGYHTTPMPNGSHWIPPVSQRAASKYDLRLFFEYFNRGFEKVFLYEFADIAYSSETADLNFGLLTSDGTPKARFFALRNLLQLLRDPGPAFSTTHLDYELTGATPELQHTLLQKRDGTFYLVLWLNQLSFNATTKQDLEVSRSVGLTVRAPMLAIESYRPVESEAPVGVPSTAGEVELEVSDQPLILKLTPAK